MVVKPEAEVRTALRGTNLDADMRVPFCGQTGTVHKHDADDDDGRLVFP